MEERLDADVQRLCRRLYRDLDTPRSLTCKILLDNEEYGQLVGLTIDPKHYLTADDFARDYQATELLRKCAGLNTGIDTKSVAEASFQKTEQACKRTNDRLDPFLCEDRLLDESQWRILDFVKRVQKRIAKVLGAPPACVNGRFGPGATFESRDKKLNRCPTIGDKITTFTCTPDAVPYLEEWVYPTPWGRAIHAAAREGLCSPLPTCVSGNRFTTVPKDATKDRGICVEPGSNVFMQLGVGRHLRHRLRYWAMIDLDYGQDLHRKIAEIASRDGSWSTLDLSSASDTVARKLVALLLPKAWYHLLDNLRSKKTLLNGKWYHLEKFSSMGNGFTFELESLIFWAISSEASRGERVHVYGDDILCKTEYTADVTAALRFFGFTLNDRKSFSDGLFRESCGGDFFDGTAVRPYHLKELPANAFDWLSLANGLYRNLSCRYRLSGARLSALDNLPTAVRNCVGPQLLGDLVVNDEDSTKWNFKIRNGIRYFRCYKPIVDHIRLSRFDSHTQLAVALHGADNPRDRFDTETSALLAIRGSIKGWKFSRVPYS